MTGPGVELPGARFGAAGQVVLTGAHSASLGQTSYKSGASRLGYRISPGVDWFVVKNLSLGADASVAHFDDVGFLSDGSTARDVGSSWSVGARVAYNVPLGAWASWYPRVTIGYEETTSDERFGPDVFHSFAGEHASAPGASLVVTDARARGYDVPTGRAYESVTTQVGGVRRA